MEKTTDSLNFSSRSRGESGAYGFDRFIDLSRRYQTDRGRVVAVQEIKVPTERPRIVPVE